MRKSALIARAAIAPGDARLAAQAVADKASELLGKIDRASSPSIVSGYHPIRDELDPLPLMQVLEARGFTLALPVTVAPATPLVFRHWRWGSPLVPAKYGIWEPSADSPSVAPTVILVPLVAFDAHGHRLGYGAGHYDATLRDVRAKQSVVAIGLGFEAQQVARVPQEPTDERLDFIVTPAGVIRCKE